MTQPATLTKAGEAALLGALLSGTPLSLTSVAVDSSVLACTGNELAADFTAAYVATPPKFKAYRVDASTLRIALPMDQSVGTFDIGTVGVFSTSTLLALAAFPSAGSKVASNLPTILGNVRTLYVDLVYASVASAIAALPGSITEFEAAYGVGALSARQLRLQLQVAGGYSVIATAVAGLSVTSAVAIAWATGAPVVPGDPLDAFVQSTLGYNSTTMAAFRTAAAALQR